MTTASTIALIGRGVFKHNLNLTKDFWEFFLGLMELFMGSHAFSYQKYGMLGPVSQMHVPSTGKELRTDTIAYRHLTRIGTKILVVVLIAVMIRYV